MRTKPPAADTEFYKNQVINLMSYNKIQAVSLMKAVVKLTAKATSNSDTKILNTIFPFSLLYIRQL